MICIDTSILIEYFRKKNKENTMLFQIAKHESNLAISSITKYEIYCGSTEDQISFWNSLFENFTILEFGDETSHIASEIYKSLKKSNKLIGIADILIAACALEHDAKMATINHKDFSRISNLNISR